MPDSNLLTAARTISTDKMLPTFHLRANRDGGLPEGTILYLPEYAAEIHRVGDAISDYPISANAVLSVDVFDHAPYDIVIASLRESAGWFAVEDSIMKREGCWTCVCLPPFDVSSEGEALRVELGVSAVMVVGASVGMGPRRTVISTSDADFTILGEAPRAIWNGLFLASGKYPASLRTMEVE